MINSLLWISSQIPKGVNQDLIIFKLIEDAIVTHVEHSNLLFATFVTNLRKALKEYEPPFYCGLKCF